MGSFGRRACLGAAAFAIILSAMAAISVFAWKSSGTPRPELQGYQPRTQVDAGGLATVFAVLKPWPPNATLTEISSAWQGIGYRTIEDVDERLAGAPQSLQERLSYLVAKASLLTYEGEPKKAYEVLSDARSQLESDAALNRAELYSIIFFQGVAALRRGEDENCIMCRGESSCILPIAPAAVHPNPAGSRLAIQHFTEYLDQFPDDIEVQWLLNLAHMTLGEHPEKVDPKFLISLERFNNSEFDIGKFRDVGHLVGVNRLNQSGGAIMEDFDNDGLLDIATTSWDATAPMRLYRNNGMGTFEDCTEAAGLADQLGGLNCLQTDYDNDGWMDIFIVRGAWLTYPERPSLLRNNGNGTFTDVTAKAGLLHPMNSIAASWADYDNDGWLDLFVCGEQQPSRLYHNMQNGAFEEVSSRAGALAKRRTDCKGAAWFDYDNDGYPDLFLNYFTPYVGTQLLHNDRNGAFTDVAAEMHIDGPLNGFSCWAWDYDNDGWLDIFAVRRDSTPCDVITGLRGDSHSENFNRLYRNRQGRRFEDKTREVGLGTAYAAMGSNFADFDNDGFLDFYLGTGNTGLEFLCPNRMFKNVSGRRFSEITGSTGTGNLQKGHGVACGDWDRDGDVDLFIEMGGAVNGDKYHNILFQNPGQRNHWLTVKLVGVKTNRAAIGARIKVVASSEQPGSEPLTVYRHISSGSSFGANPFEQTIGLAQSERIELLEIQWPTSGTMQVFRDLAVDQSIRITEFSDSYETLDVAPITIAE